jgi:hypothetical protein
MLLQIDPDLDRVALASAPRDQLDTGREPAGRPLEPLGVSSVSHGLPT